jgi:hypothetical protein
VAVQRRGLAVSRSSRLDGAVGWSVCGVSKQLKRAASRMEAVIEGQIVLRCAKCKRQQPKRSSAARGERGVGDLAHRND